MSSWHIFHTRRRTPFYVDLYTLPFAYHKRRVLNFDYHGRLFHINGVIAMVRNEWDRHTREMKKTIKKDSGFLLRLIKVQYRDHKQVISFWKGIEGLPLKKFTNRDLANLLAKYAKSVGDFLSIGLGALYAEEYLTDEITRFIHSKLPVGEAEKVLQIFLTPKKEGVVGEEYRKFLKIDLLPTSEQKKALLRHHKNFCWMSNPLYTQTFAPLSYYRERLVALRGKNPKKMLQKYGKERKHHLDSYHHWLKKIQPDKRMRLYIESLNEAIFWRSWRGERVYQSAFWAKPLFEEIARRLGISIKEFLHCTPEELEKWLMKDKQVSQKKIRERINSFVYLPTRKGLFISNPKIIKIWEKKVASISQGQAEIKGMPAYVGKVKGIACIVTSADELSKVRKGDILIAPSTTPLYVPVLGKVIAIVTEEGGVLSHASVISRELKIPCIIGTKIATKVLRDGDIVEVDAEKGVVRKIK